MRVRIKLTGSNHWVIEYKNWWNITWQCYALYRLKDAALHRAELLKNPVIEEIK